MQQKERRTPTLRNSMDRTGDHYAKWSKPDGKRQIPHDITFNRNLINKTNKQNITRDTEIKNKLTITRGEVGVDGEKGKGFQEQL